MTGRGLGGSIGLPRVALLALLCTGVAALAQTPPASHARDASRHTQSARPPEPAWPRVASRPPRPELRLDQRYHHNHTYPPRGHAVSALPGGSLSIALGGGNLFFHGGVWFRPSGGRFIVAVPPLGIVVPVLPPAYARLWIGGQPYYYANDVYYAVAPGQGYVVVAPPPGAENVQLPSAAPAPAVPAEPIIYPRVGQTAQQTEADRRECNRWATTQAGAMADASIFERAAAACLDGRGYTVR